MPIVTRQVADGPGNAGDRSAEPLPDVDGLQLGSVDVTGRATAGCARTADRQHFSTGSAADREAVQGGRAVVADHRIRPDQGGGDGGESRTFVRVGDRNQGGHVAAHRRPVSVADQSPQGARARSRFPAPEHGSRRSPASPLADSRRQAGLTRTRAHASGRSSVRARDRVRGHQRAARRRCRHTSPDQAVTSPTELDAGRQSQGQKGADCGRRCRRPQGETRCAPRVVRFHLLFEQLQRQSRARSGTAGNPGATTRSASHPGRTARSAASSAPGRSTAADGRGDIVVGGRPPGCRNDRSQGGEFLRRRVAADDPKHRPTLVIHSGAHHRSGLMRSERGAQLSVSGLVRSIAAMRSERGAQLNVTAGCSRASSAAATGACCAASAATGSRRSGSPTAG